MKQYQHHPDRDEVLEFEVPDDAVYFAVGGRCPTCLDDLRVIEIDFLAKNWKCGLRIGMPLHVHHDGLPPQHWYVTIPKLGAAFATIRTDSTSTVVWPVAHSGADKDGGSLLLDSEPNR